MWPAPVAIDSGFLSIRLATRIADAIVDFIAPLQQVLRFK